MTSRRLVSSLALAAVLISSPAFAGEKPPELAYDPVPPAGDYPPPPAPPGGPVSYDAARPLPPGPDQDLARAEWLDRCRAHYRDDGVGGALIGGAIGGVAGNRIAGKGNRTVGTVAGAAVGAVAGAAIDKAEDRGRARDACEDYLDRYTAYYSAGGPGAGYYYQPGYYQPGAYGSYSPYGYGAGYMMVPVRVDQRPCRCKEEVIEEEVDVPVARRVIPRRSAPADKRVKYVK